MYTITYKRFQDTGAIHSRNVTEEQLNHITFILIVYCNAVIIDIAHN